MRYVHRFCVSRKGGTGGGGWGHPQGDICTWWLLGLAVKVPWLGPCGSILALAAWTDFENTTLMHLVGGSFLAGKAAWALNRCMTTESADYCMLVTEWAWSRSRMCLLRLEVDLSSVLESELGQKWRYGALN